MDKAREGRAYLLCVWTVPAPDPGGSESCFAFRVIVRVYRVAEATGCRSAGGSSVYRWHSIKCYIQLERVTEGLSTQEKWTEAL